MNPAPEKKTVDPRGGYLVAALVFGVSLIVGFFVLPYLGARRAEESELANRPAPDFILPYLSPKERGQSQRLSDLQGKAVVLDFWASWCRPCREQTPVLERVASSIGAERLTVLGVATSDDEAAVRRFLDQHPMQYPSVYDADGTASTQYRVQGLPTLAVIRKDGTVTAVATGLMSEGELRRLISDALR